MKVCHFVSTTAGGAYFDNLFHGLVLKGITPICVELGEHNPPKWLAQIPQAEYFNLGVRSKYKYPLAVWRLARLLRREKVDILQTHLYDSGLIGVIAGRMAQTPLVIVTRHHTSIVKMLGKKYHTVIDRLMADTADGVVVVSEAVRRFMKESDKVKKDHIEVIHIGFDFNRLIVSGAEREKIRREFGFSANAFVVGYVGQFIRAKGHPQLVEAFCQISQKIPEARLLLVGSGDCSETGKKIEKLNLKDKVIFAGWREDIPACIKAMDVFVQPSLSEAFSQVIIEAMGTGTPVVATTVGGADEVISQGETGLLVPPDDPSAIADAVFKLYENQPLRESLVLKAQAHVRKTFTVEKMVTKQIDFYHRYFNKKTGKKI